MVLTCMEEAKRIVDKAYKDRRERWGFWVRLFPAFQRRNRQQGTRGWRWGPLPVGLSIFGCENVFKTMPPRPCLWTPSSKLCLQRQTCFPALGPSSPQLWAGALQSVSRSVLWAHPSLPQAASSSGFTAARPAPWNSCPTSSSRWPPPGLL